MKKLYIYKIILLIVCIIFATNTNVIFAQSNNTLDDCAIDISTSKITADGSVKDYGIMTYNDLLYIYNDLQKNCKGTANNNIPVSNSYIVQIYTSLIKNKFLLDTKTDSNNMDTAIIADPIAKKWYDKKIDYYSGDKGLNPEIIKADFDELRKYGAYTDSINKDTCVYKGDSTKGLYDKIYNLCEMTNCIRGKIITKNNNPTAIKADYENCKTYIDNVMSGELNRATDMIINYSAKMTNNNFDTYINKYYGSKLDKVKLVNQKMDSMVNGLLKKITDFTHSCMG